MDSVYLFCALVGGSVLVIQFVLVALGIGGMEDGDADGGVGDVGDVGDVSEGGTVSAEVGDTAQASSTSNWLFGMLSLKTLVAGATFFGLIGMGMKQAGSIGPVRHVAAVAAGLVAVFLVNWVMRSLSRLNADGTFRIEHSVGATGRVYLSVPAAKSGNGKIHLSVHGRMVELKAVSAGAAIPTGTNVVVVGTLTNDTVEIRTADNLEPTSA